MKNNEERVKSIITKAKHYKSVRLKVLSSLTTAICAVAIVTTGIVFSARKESLPSVDESENLVVATNVAKEIELPSFKSKEELISRLSEKIKKNEEIFNGIAYIEDSDTAGMDLQKEASSLRNDEEAAGDSSSDYSKTNTQVQGVDEADIVKTNGKNIYYLSRKDNILRVFDSSSNEIKLVHEINLGENKYASQMYLDDNYIIVLADIISLDDMSAKIAYIPSMSRSFTGAFVYDINTYELVRKIEIEGSVISSRKVGNDVYIVTNKYISTYDINEDNILPLYKDTCESGEYVEVQATDIKYFEDFEKAEDCSYMIITSFNLDDMESKVNINTFLGAGSEIYCSKENLYVAKIDYGYSSIFSRMTNAIMMVDTEANSDNSSTSIHKFAISGGNVKYVATGKVSGRLLNQFSMDEYNGYFRITTTNNVSGNNLFVLDEKLEQVGCIEELASGERIYATRFMGDKAYIVTYKTVDPLFVIDLSNPEKPSVLGELKIPGYSSYLHPLGENYLIGIGEDSVEKSYLNWEGKQEVVAYSTGLKMAIFDVSDYNNPKEVYSVKIGGRGSYSEILYNHKALLFNEEEGIIAFPASVTSEAGEYDNGVPRYGETIFNGALVYNINVEDGISLRGKISHNKDGKYDDGIERIIYIGDKLYTISSDMIMSSDIDTIERISELQF